MHQRYSLLSFLIMTFIAGSIYAQGICNPAGNIIIYSNYDGGNMTINIDENVPDIRIGICTYEAINVSITGPYADNVTQVLYAGYNSGGTTSVTGVDAGIVDILMYPPVTLYDPDGYPYMICAYVCDSTYVPGGCNTVDQAVDYFVTELPGSIRYSYFQYGVYTGTYDISDGGNCCFGAACTATVDAGQDETICAGDSVELGALGGVTFSWSPIDALIDPTSDSPVAFPTTTTTYYVTATDADGCVGVDSMTVFVNPLPEPDINVTGTTLTASGGTSYQWFQDGVAIPGATDASYNVTENGLYSVEVTSADGCTAMSIEVNMVVNGIDENNMVNSVLIFPNPADAYVSIRSGIRSADAAFMITDIFGRTVAQGMMPLSGQLQLSVDTWVPGMYQILITDAAWRAAGCFIVGN